MPCDQLTSIGSRTIGFYIIYTVYIKFYHIPDFIVRLDTRLKPILFHWVLISLVFDINILYRYLNTLFLTWHVTQELQTNAKLCYTVVH